MTLLKVFLSLYIASIIFNCYMMYRGAKQCLINGKARFHPMFIVVNLNPVRAFLGTIKFCRDPEWLVKKYNSVITRK